MIIGRTVADRTRITRVGEDADGSGAAAVEYGIVTLIAVAVLLAVNAVGGNITSIFERLAAAFTN
jgi:Flp pilus assembly pilin Flp